jgi:hypothetical protein
VVVTVVDVNVVVVELDEVVDVEVKDELEARSHGS